MLLCYEGGAAVRWLKVVELSAVVDEGLLKVTKGC